MTEAEWLASADPSAMLRHLEDGRRYHEGRGAVHDFYASDRKLRLFACGCCCLCWPLLTDPRSRAAVEVAERYADGEATVCDMSRAADESARGPDSHRAYSPFVAAIWCCAPSMVADVLNVVRNCNVAPDMPAAQAALAHCVFGNPHRPAPCQRINGRLYPLRRVDEEAPATEYPVPWLTPTVLSLARVAYEERGQACPKCRGKGVVDEVSEYGSGAWENGRPTEKRPCTACGGTRTNDRRLERPGTGCTGGGLLCPDRLAILADALEDGGATDEPVLAHLRNPGPHVRGCHVIDNLLGKA